jgi:hypothetical protein
MLFGLKLAVMVLRKRRGLSAVGSDGPATGQEVRYPCFILRGDECQHRLKIDPFPTGEI